MQVARSNRDVKERLQFIYGTDHRMVGILFGFWMQLAGLGEEIVKQSMRPRTFYYNRKLLQEAGISWFNTNVYVLENKHSVLPQDFKPFRSDARLCTNPAKARPYHVNRSAQIGSRALSLPTALRAA